MLVSDVHVMRHSAVMDDFVITSNDPDKQNVHRRHALSFFKQLNFFRFYVEKFSYQTRTHAFFHGVKIAFFVRPQGHFKHPIIPIMYHGSPTSIAFKHPL